MSKIIALLTDFGLKDNFVGVIKAVMLKINPQVKFIDISHNVSSQDVKEAAFLLLSSFSYFPKGTIFLVVIDPGVGSDRLPIAVKTKNYYFVGPDNGVLSLAVKKDGLTKAVVLKNKSYFLEKISSTFHGRDIFAPCCAYLSKGVSLLSLGKKIEKVKDISLPSPVIEKEKMTAEILCIDKFGNLVTNIKKDDLDKFLKGKKFVAYLKRKKINKIYSFYAQAELGEPFFIEGSFSFLEISLKNADASKYFSIKEKVKNKIVIKRIK
jgi:hypothetical protein